MAPDVPESVTWSAGSSPPDSLYILDCLINLDAGPKPEVVTTDQASDMAFGIFSMLGYRFAPRFADLGDQRFWRAEPPDGSTGEYGVLEAIARIKVNPKKVITQWPDMLRVAGSLVTNQVRAYDLLRMFARQGHPTPAGAGVRRVRPHRQDAAPAEHAGPDGFQLPPQPGQAAVGPRVEAPAGP